MDDAWQPGGLNQTAYVRACKQNQVSSAISRTKSDYAQLMKARRLASRNRAEAACLPCKAKKARCSDNRPCSRCLQSIGEECVDATRAASSDGTAVKHTRTSMFRSNSEPYLSKYRRIPEDQMSSVYPSRAMDAQYLPDLTSEFQNFNPPNKKCNGFSSAQPHSMPPYFDEQTTRRSQQNTALCTVGAASDHRRGAIWRAESARNIEWVWEAAAGPGADDPFRADWKHWESRGGGGGGQLGGRGVSDGRAAEHPARNAARTHALET